MVGAPHPPTPVGMQDPGSMLRRPKKEKLICTPVAVYHHRYIGHLSSRATSQCRADAGEVRSICLLRAFMMALIENVEYDVNVFIHYLFTISPLGASTLSVIPSALWE